jgi:RimJ/RimL family protein N-acetyltransferase
MVAADGSLLEGFTQPVVPRGCGRDGLEGGTLHHIGVCPPRGNGHADDLLRHATATLRAVGVRRLFCRTDVPNAPMIGAFGRVGHRRDRVRSVPP